MYCPDVDRKGVTMAKLATVTFTWLDSLNRTQTTERQWRLSTPPADADVQALAVDEQALTGLGLVKASVSYEVDITAQADEPEANSSRQNDWSMTVRKSTLRNSRGGTYTFRKLPQIKAALSGSTRIIDASPAAFNNFLENFDDGAGLAAVVGDWYISDGEEVVEATASQNAVVEAYHNKN